MFIKTANFISTIFHPIFIFFYVFSYLTFQSDLLIGMVYRYNITLILVYIFGNSVLLPVILIYIFKRDFHLNELRSRFIPFLIVITAYIFVFVFLSRYAIPEIIMRFLLVMIIGLAILLILNNFIKVSIHSCAAGALVAFFVKLVLSISSEFFWPLVVVFLLSGLVGTLRLALKAHSDLELYLGYLIGLVVTFVGLAI